MKRCVLLMMAAVHIAVLSGCSTLHDAAQKNDIVEIQSRIDKGAVVDSLNEFGDTPLIMAAAYGRTAAAKLLIEKGANVNFVNNVGNTPLSLAALKGDTEIARMLIERGANVNSVSNAGDTPLIMAAFKGNTDAAKLLIDKGANINDINNAGETPLSLAVINGHTEIARLLIEKNANVNNVNKSGDTPLIFAAVFARTEIARMLIEKGANVNSVNLAGNSPLSLAAFKGDTETAKRLVAQGANVNSVSKAGDTPLIMAAFKGNTEIAKLLIAKGADISARNKAGKNAQALANENNHVETYHAITASKQVSIEAALSPQLLGKLKKLVAEKDMAGLKVFLDAHPEALSSIKDVHLRLLCTGPAELRIMDIAQMVKNKRKDALIIAQIHSTSAPYKKFLAEEMDELNKMAIPDEVIAAMIAVTTAYNKEQQRIQANQSAAALPVQQATQAPVQQQKVAESNTAEDCLKLAAANKACDQAGGFAAMGCKAMAKMKYDCPIQMP